MKNKIYNVGNLQPESEKNTSRVVADDDDIFCPSSRTHIELILSFPN